MSRSALGRGLGELLQGQPVAGATDAGSAPGKPRAALSPGFERLVRAVPDAPTGDELAALQRRLSLARRALWCGDAALVLAASWLVFRPGAAPGAMDVAFGAAAVIAGAALGVVALLLDAEG